MEGFRKYLNIADEVDIMIFLSNNTSITLSSFIYDVVDEDELIISHAIKEGALYHFEKSYVYYFRFYKENYGMYLFKGVLTERLLFDNLPSLRVKLDSDIKRIQRRKFYRVNFLSRGHFLFQKQLSETEIVQMRERMLKKYKSDKEFIIDTFIQERVAFETLDLSGGGIRLICNTHFDIGEFVEGEFEISGSWVTYKGEVTRIEKKESNRYEVGIKFLELSENTQSKIVAYVFEIERNLIKKGLM